MDMKAQVEGNFRETGEITGTEAEDGSRVAVYQKRGLIKESFI